MSISERPRNPVLAEQAEAGVSRQFKEIEKVSEINTSRVLEAFNKYRVSDTMFAGTTGYGYDDRGRDTLDSIFAEIFEAEDAIARINFVNGTHAITCALFGALKPGQTLLSAIGAPYDTLHGVIGIAGNNPGTLKSYGIGYKQAEVRPDGLPDIGAIADAVDDKVGAVLIQRSRGYSLRKTLSCEMIGEICSEIKKKNKDVNIIVDNCYGEFTQVREPICLGADIAVGSLIKNPGGGLAPTGGYIAGRHDLVEAAAMRMTAPGIGRHCGCTLGQNRSLFQGLFQAPHTVAQALKTAVFCASITELMGFKPDPGPLEPRYDIIQTITFGAPEPMLKFCKGIQSGAPVDSYLTPEPWDMPGYDVPVVMAAGSFIQGASIELSCDGPMREPYTAFIQGGLTYESGKHGIIRAVKELLKI